jgi:type IV secretion system protein VirB6
MTCAALAPATGFVSGVLDFVDCQAQAIGAGGYQALASPGSTLSLVLAGLLVLFVALFGYRMLLGHVPGVRDGVLALVKIGIVLALATGWTAYRTLFYDVMLKGPAELAAEISGPAALPGAGGGLVVRLDYADRALVTLAALDVGEETAGATTPAAEPGQPPLPTAAAQRARGFDTLALGGARILFLAGAIGALAAVRLVAGLLLALGPFFIAFLLFEGTRGLFEGWLRVLAGTALGALGTAVALGVELALIEPWLAELIARRTAGQPIAGAPVELFVVALVFALALLAMLIAAARVAYGFRLPPVWRDAPARAAAALRGGQVSVSRTVRDPGAAAADRSRAATVADAVAASQRREGASAAAPAGQAAGAVRPAARHALARDLPPPAPVPLGQSFRRRTRGRFSATARRRDASA